MISQAQRYEHAAVDALSAALWSSDDADRMFQIVRPRDFHPVDDTIAAAMFDLRRRGISWTDPLPAAETLRDYRQLWKDRVDSGRFGLPKIVTPVEDLLDPDRWPLRFASRPLTSGRIFDIQSHIAEVDVGVAAGEVAACRRHEVAEATMQTVHEILTAPPAGSTRRERQQAISAVLHGYRRDMSAAHLYPPRPAARANRAALDLRR
jgi:hypothetical protein